ncbi:MARE1 [Hepatospora eriocheir]|uniref:MARE1 n=1 Tax=Hepatospora eriocheir TaxID=1081669 RepID=A0A1X0QD89_9MICR|nr:MARE1 [Hepatospora eriocheir]
MIFIGKGELINWVNKLNIKISRIEDVGKGEILCLIINKYYPDKLPIDKIRLNPRSQNDYLYNLSLVKSFFNSMNIRLLIPISKMINLRLQDNLEILQYFYNHFNKLKIYNFNDKKDLNDNNNLNDNNKVNFINNDLNNKINDKVDNNNNDKDKINNKDNDNINDNINLYKKACNEYQKEVNFYYQKLVKIESLLKKNDDFNKDELINLIADVLYEK